MRTGRFKGAFLSILIAVSLIVPAISLLSVSPSSAAPEGLTPHAPIYIDGNDNFTLANGVTSGSGTENDPYIIEGWDISADNANGIEIRNTTAYFIIRNSYVHDGIGNNHIGILLRNLTNGRIDNAVSANNWHGIYLGSSSNSIVENSTVRNNFYGIYVWASSNNYLRNNVLSNNTRNLGVLGVDVSHYYQDIDNSNRVNGRPTYYVIGRENLTFDGSVMDIGYLGLISGKNILVKNLVIANNVNGILLADTSQSRVTDSTLTNNSYGVHFVSSSNNTIENITALNNAHGIAFHFSSNNNIIRNNTYSNSSSYGIFIYLYSDNNRVYHNNIVNNVNQARDERSNYWDNGYPSGGNYWSDYTGEDADNDGIGDTPYLIPGGTNLDRYPSMNPIVKAPSGPQPGPLLGPRWDLIIGIMVAATVIIGIVAALYMGKMRLRRIRKRARRRRR